MAEGSRVLGHRRSRWSLGEGLDDADSVVGAVSVLAGEADQFACAGGDGAGFGGAGDGDPVSAAPASHLNIATQYLDAIRQGLRETSFEHGIATDVFGDFPEQVYGETGTAQYSGQQDYAWYAGYRNWLPARYSGGATVARLGSWRGKKTCWLS